MLLVEEISYWAIIGSHVIGVCTNPLFTTEDQSSKTKKREFSQTR